MTKTEYRNAVYDVIYLVRCAINGTVPDKARVENINLEHLYHVAQSHMLTAMVCYALESAGLFDKRFHQAKSKSVRKIAVMEIDKELLFAEMEKAKIWYVPLKGTVIKNLYPAIGLRQMSDFDILFDKNYDRKVREILYGLGFICKDFGRGNHDIYRKPPVSCFEMHTALFSEIYKKELYDYYCHIEDHLIKDADNGYGYHFNQ